MFSNACKNSEKDKTGLGNYHLCTVLPLIRLLLYKNFVTIKKNVILRATTATIFTFAYK